MKASVLINGIPFRGKDLTGQKFNRLTVITLARVNKVPTGTIIFWRCQCECLEGPPIEVEAGKLKSGHTRSCGCYQVLRATQVKTTHGCTRGPNGRPLPIYKTWQAMTDRCSNPNHSGWYLYGAIGIRVCGRWKEFSGFKKDMGPTWKLGLTLDRINPFGPYAPHNCRWATPKAQSVNRRSDYLASLLLDENKVSVAVKLARWYQRKRLAAKIIV